MLWEKFLVMRLNNNFRDKNIVLEKEKHIYCVNGELYQDTITSFIKTFFYESNAQTILDNYYEHWQEKGHSVYQFMTRKEILDYWDKKSKDALFLGNKLHHNIDDFYNDLPYEEEFLTHIHFFPFWREHLQYNVYRTEWIIYDEHYKIAGTLDMLYEKEGKFYLYDWKRVQSINKSKYFRKALHTIENIPDNNYWRYSLQLNMYRYILKSCYDIEVEEMYLVIFYEDNEQYKKIPVKCLQKEIYAMLEYRLQS